MKMKFDFLLYVLFFLLPFNVFSQQEAIHVNFTDNTTMTFLLDDVQKLDFTEDQTILHLTDGMVLSWDFEAIDYYNYRDEVITTSANLLKSSLRLDVYPNPSQNDIHVNFDILSKQDAKLTVMSIDGKEVEMKQLTGVSKENVFIDISSYPAGQYILVLAGASFNLSKSFIKN